MVFFFKMKKIEKTRDEYNKVQRQQLELEKYREKIREETAKYRSIVSPYINAARLEELLAMSAEELEHMEYSDMVGENHGKR